MGSVVGGIGRHDPAVTKGVKMFREKTVNIQFLGAAGYVTGSKYPLQTAGAEDAWK